MISNKEVKPTKRKHILIRRLTIKLRKPKSASKTRFMKLLEKHRIEDTPRLTRITG